MPFAGDDTSDPETWINVLRSWLSVPIDWVISGHHPVCGPGEILRHLEFFESLKGRTLGVLCGGMSPEDIIASPPYEQAEPSWFWEKTRARWLSYHRAAVKEGRERL